MRTGPRVRLTATLVVATFAACAPMVALPAIGATATWTVLGTGSANNISGLASIDSGWVIVRDNKTAGTNRIALLGADDSVTALVWPGSQPSDLEALDSVPGQSGQYVAMSSSATGYLLTLAGTTVTIQRSFTAPRGSNIEGFALTPVGTTFVAVWATRGSTTKPAKMFAATFAPSTGAFGRIVTGSVSVPYPTTSVRQVSDIKIINGHIVVSSSSDPGNNGPFNSALYDVGSVTVVAGRATLALGTAVSLGTFPGHKVEGVACSGTTGLLGSDDENLGGAIRTASFCG